MNNLNNISTFLNNKNSIYLFKDRVKKIIIVLKVKIIIQYHRVQKQKKIYVSDNS